MSEALNPLDSENIPATHELGRSTGPRTPAGKARSSLNRLTHGCRSEQILLKTEDPEEFEFTMQAWFDHYQPGDDELAGLLVHETAIAHWFLKRNRRRLAQVEVHLPGNAWNWTDEHLKLYTNFSRYTTAAERAFRRCLKDVELYFARQHRREQLDALAAAKLAAIDSEWLAKKQKEAARPSVAMGQQPPPAQTPSDGVSNQGTAEPLERLADLPPDA